MSPIGRFVVWMLAYDFLGFAVGSAVAGGDPSLQPYVVGPVFVLAPAAAYLTVYRGGEDRLRAALGLSPADGGDGGAEEGDGGAEEGDGGAEEGDGAAGGGEVGNGKSRQ